MMYILKHFLSIFKSEMVLRIMKVQNELIENANKKLKDEVIDFKKRVNYSTGKFE